jgi:hypothetical protein
MCSLIDIYFIFKQNEEKRQKIIKMNKVIDMINAIELPYRANLYGIRTMEHFYPHSEMDKLKEELQTLKPYKYGAKMFKNEVKE